MSRLAHRIYISVLVSVTIIVFLCMGLNGADYYLTDISQRFFHSQNVHLKPSGLIGHGAGIVGSLLMTVGVFGYMARKRIQRLTRLGQLKHWLEFHIFLCTIGPVLVLYHTAFKFGGLVALSFWSMVAVMISGVIGRFIYLQIPRTIEGREISLNELHIKKARFSDALQGRFKLDSTFMELVNHPAFTEEDLYRKSFFIQIIKRLSAERRHIRSLKTELRKRNIPGSERKKIVRNLRNEIVLGRRIAWLSTMQQYLNYWHVLHLPFALIMLVIMIIHIIVAILFGYTWII